MTILCRACALVLICLCLVACSKAEEGAGKGSKCPSSSDSVKVVQAVVRAKQKCLESEGHDVRGRMTIVNETQITVPALEAGGGLADVTFPEAGTCTLYRLIAEKSAKLVNRLEGTLFWQFRGKTVCTTRGGQVKAICGTQNVFVSTFQQSRVAQWTCSSDPDPQLVVAVRQGVIRVTPGEGGPSVIVRSGEAYDALSGSLGDAIFTDLDLRLFGRQGGTARVDVTESGPGSVTATGISCGEDCSQVYTLGSVITLTARPSAGARFVSWSGDCQGSETTCQVAIDGPRTVGATFELTTPSVAVGNPLTVTTSGPGVVVSKPSGIECGSDCDERYEGGSVVLSASSDADALFIGWTGNCSGRSSTCSVAMSGPRTVGAEFAACTIVPDTATVVGTSGDDVICAGSFTTGLTIDGLGGDDVIVSGSANDTLTGGDGDDLIMAGAGDDSIEAGSGIDTVDGGDGIDYCDGEESGASCEHSIVDAGIGVVGVLRS